VPLSVDSRPVGDLTVLTCRGRLVEGAETNTLRTHLDELMGRSPRLVLDLGGIEFMDSSGLGLLARYLIRARDAHGNIKLCAVSPKFDEVLKTTKLGTIFETYDSEEAAIAAFDQTASAG
jgi:anti-sigma B factor antagonist